MGLPVVGMCDGEVVPLDFDYGQWALAVEYENVRAIRLTPSVGAVVRVGLVSKG